jgi:hypothetical protein
MNAQYKYNAASGFEKPPKVYKCKVCFDAGKPASMYNSHFVRETPNIHSRVVCPTLLSMICTYCHKKGHTQSRCLKRERDETVASRTSSDTTSVMSWSTDTNSSVHKTKAPKNTFSLLCEDSDDDNNNESISTIDEHGEDDSLEKSPYLMALLKPTPVVASTKIVIRDMFRNVYNKAKSWADWSDSDEE